MRRGSAAGVAGAADPVLVVRPRGVPVPAAMACCVAAVEAAATHHAARLLRVAGRRRRLVAGAVGALAAGPVASALARRLLDAQLAWQLAPVPVPRAAPTLPSAITRALANRGMLARPALEVLREDA